MPFAAYNNENTDENTDEVFTNICINQNGRCVGIEKTRRKCKESICYLQNNDVWI